jgi:hypothetical protein
VLFLGKLILGFHLCKGADGLRPEISQRYGFYTSLLVKSLTDSLFVGVMFIDYRA